MKNSRNFFVVLVVMALALSGCQNPFLQLGGSSVSTGAPPSGHISLPVTPSAEFMPGTGVPGDPYLVYDVATLQRVGTEGEGEGEWGLTKHYKQIEDIDMGDAGNWMPIGSSANPFSGSYNGGGKTISNLNCIYTSTDEEKGLFGYLGEDAVAEGIGLLKAEIQGACVGGIAANNYGTIQNCFVKEGIIGNYGGGIAGKNYGTIQSCFFDGPLDGTILGGNAGGITGYNYYDGIIKNCYSAGSYSGKQNIGGIAGYSVGTILNCYSVSEVVSHTVAWVGGIMACTGGSWTVRNCVALNRELNGSFAYGRVMGVLSLSSASFNYANPEMLVNGETVSGNASNENGEDITGDYHTIEWWTTEAVWATGEAWDFDTVWDWGANDLPILRNVGGQ